MGWGRDTGTEESDRQLGRSVEDRSGHHGDVDFYFEQGGKPLENLGQRTFVLTSPSAGVLSLPC